MTMQKQEKHGVSADATRRTFRGWTPPGPDVPGGVDVEDGETLDALTGQWRIFQLKGGHRFSTDDLVCAWYASQWAPRVDRYCDLGAGIGSVSLTVAWRLPGAQVVTLEAQSESLRLQRKSIAYNGVSDRFTTLHGDIRTPDSLLEMAPFDLVTGSPPYWALSDATAAKHEQAVGARLETRGAVEDYAQTAAKILAPGGVFACVFQAAQDDRVRRAIDAAGLALLRTRPIQFKAGVDVKLSGIQVYVAHRRVDLPGGWARAPIEEPALTIRNTDGTIDAEYNAVKLSFGFPPDG